ncbi:MAG: hypothetical protein KDD69_13635 [Bdellovibrionales bacterium]|nr:hypothetical protein [Bdellovibrionales bacterium]
MSIDYLEDLARAIDNGKEIFVCPGLQTNEWILSEDKEELRKKAQRTANGRKFQVNIYRLVNKMDTVAEDSYLVVRRILEASPTGVPRFQWSIVDTREAADMMRDVSQGPTPYFGAVVEETFDPE